MGSNLRPEGLIMSREVLGWSLIADINQGFPVAIQNLLIEQVDTCIAHCHDGSGTFLGYGSRIDGHHPANLTNVGSLFQGEAFHAIPKMVDAGQKVSGTVDHICVALLK